MVIVFKKNNQYIYKSEKGFLDEEEIEQAEKMAKALDKEFTNFEKKMKKLGKIKQNKKKDVIFIWYNLGKLIRKYITKYEIKTETLGINEFWRALYDFSPTTIINNFPNRSKSLTQNHFYLCYLISEFDWNFVKKVGNWAIWREIFDNKQILKDEKKRVLIWVANKISFFKKNGIKDHKKIRPFLYAVSKRIKNLETRVLSDQELINKLEEIKFKIDKKGEKLILKN